MRRSKYLLTAVAALAALALTPATPAEAALTCNAGGNYFNGFQYNPASGGHTMRGVQANIVARPSSLCTTLADDSNFSTSWTMWAGAPQSTTTRSYIQSGYMKIGSKGYTDYFSEYAKSTGGFNRVFVNSQATSGTVQNFQQIYDSNGTTCPGRKCAASYRGVNLMQSTPYDPVVQWPGPYLANYYAETSNSNTDVPGSPAAQTNFTGMLFIDANGAVISQPCGMSVQNDIPGRWDQATQACDQRSVWTK